MITSLCANIIQNYYKKTQAVSAAHHLKKVNDAACAYFKDNFTQTCTEKIFTIKLQQLINQGYLPNGFFTKNSYSQKYRIQILVPTEQQKDWQILTITEKGDQIDLHAWTVLGSLLKHRGFYRSKSTKKIIDGLRQPSNSSIIEMVDPGHIAFLQVIDNIRLYATNTFIYRKINDNDSPRPMQTSLKLNKNSIIFKKNFKEVKLNNQSLELKNKNYMAKLELLNKENIPSLYLKGSDTSDSKCLTINSSSIKIHRKPLIYSSCQYDVKKKVASLFYIKYADQLHWSTYWNHIPCHQCNFEYEQGILQSANNICRYNNNNRYQISMGRLFIINSIKKIQIFICGRDENNESIKAYALFTSNSSSNKNRYPQQKIYLGKDIKGFSFRENKKNDLKSIEFFRDNIKLIYILCYLENQFDSAKENKSTAIHGLTKSLNDFYKKIEDPNKEKLTEKLSDIITNEKVKFCNLKKLMSPKEIAEKFIEYKKDTKVYTPQKTSSAHINTLQSILDDLNKVLDPKEKLSVQDFFSKEKTKTYLDNLKVCSNFYTAWLPTVYVFSKRISLAHPDNDHLFLKTFYQEDAPYAANASESNTFDDY